MDFFAKSKHLSTWQPHLGHLLCRFRLVTWLLQFLHMNDIACSPFLNAFSNGCGCFISLYHNFVNISTVSQVRIYPKCRCIYGFANKFWTVGATIVARGRSMNAPTLWRFESVYRPEMVEMHLQNFEKLQSRKKRRNLSKSQLVFCACRPLDSLFCGKATAGYPPFESFHLISQNKRPPYGGLLFCDVCPI